MKFLSVILLGLISAQVLAQQVYVNPVDGKSYVANWERYAAEGGAVEDIEGRVTIHSVRLLSTQSQFARNMTATELAGLIMQIRSILETKSEEYENGGEILLQVALDKSNKPDFEMSYRGELTEVQLDKFNDALSAVDHRTNESDVTFQIHFVIEER